MRHVQVVRVSPLYNCVRPSEFFLYFSGYASSLEGKKASVELEKTEEEFLEFLMSLYPRHQNKDIHLFKVTWQRTLERVIQATPATLRAANYQGTVIVKTQSIFITPNAYFLK
jgi:hypothetical protein